MWGEERENTVEYRNISTSCAFDMSGILSESSWFLTINTYSRKRALNQLLRISLHYLMAIWGQAENSYPPISHQHHHHYRHQHNKITRIFRKKKYCFCKHKTEVLPPGRTFALRALQYGAGGVWVGALVSGRWRRRSLLRQSGAASCTWLRSQRQGGGRSRGRSWKSDEMTWLVEKQVRPERTGTQGKDNTPIM